MNKYKTVSFEDPKIDPVISKVNQWLADHNEIEVISSNLAVRPITGGNYFTIYILYKEL